MDKADLRDQLKQLRQNVPDTERLKLSEQICRKLEAIDWSGVRTLHCFTPIAKLGEVDITGFIQKLQAQYPEIQRYTSRKLNGEWRIVSWQGHDTVQYLQFDAVIVPMLGFDHRLHRIGYGGGHYDQFLATQPQVRKIGVCFEQGKVANIPDESHDIPLDIILTEVKIYSY